MIIESLANKNSSKHNASARRIVEVVLALVLFTAAGLKTYQLQTYGNLALPPVIHSKQIFAGLIQFELLLATWLLLGTLSRPRLLFAVLCFAAFSAVASYEAIRGLPNCGCFGAVKVSPGVAAVFDILAVAGLLFTQHRSIITGPVSRWHRVLIITFGMILSGLFWTFFIFSERSEPKQRSVTHLVIFEPELWINKPFELINEIDNGEQLRQGRWLVVFYHYDCESCRQAIPFYAELAKSEGYRSSKNPRVVFIAIPPVAPEGRDPVSGASNYSHLLLRSDHDWFATTPVVAAIDNGTVLWAADGERAIHPPSISQWKQ
jgi:hypothetical protein